MRRHPLLAIAALALVVRLVLLLATPDAAPTFDAADYDRHATAIAAGDGYPATEVAPGGGPTALRPPAYPYALGAVYAVSGQHWRAGRAFGALLGALGVLLLGLLAQRLLGRAAGLAAAGIGAVHPPLVALSGALLAENLVIPLVLGALLATLAYRDSGALRWALLAGALTGAAGLTRVNALVLLLPVVAGLATAGRRRWPAPAAAVFATVLVLAPWVARNAVEFDAFVPVSTQSGYTMAGAYNGLADQRGPLRGAWQVPQEVPELAGLFRRPNLDEAELDDELREHASAYARRHPGYVVELAALNVLRQAYLSADPAFRDLWDRELGISDTGRILVVGGFYVLLLAALAGAATATRRGALQHVPLFVWLTPPLLYLSSLPLLGNPRYRLVVDPFLALLAALPLAGRREAAGQVPPSL